MCMQGGIMVLSKVSFCPHKNALPNPKTWTGQMELKTISNVCVCVCPTEDWN